MPRLESFYLYVGMTLINSDLRNFIITTIDPLINLILEPKLSRIERLGTFYICEKDIDKS